MQNYLRYTEIIDYDHPLVAAEAKRLAEGLHDDVAIAKRCFEFVRDEIRHSGDAKDEITTCKASEVLEHRTGWCYAKSHLLAALLRANGIPTGFSYQRLSCSEYKPGIYCLHGLNWVYLKDYGWYRVDARGNNEGVDAQFDPPYEKLAFEVGEDEFDLSGNYAEPLAEVLEALQTYKRYEELVCHFPDIKSKEEI